MKVNKYEELINRQQSEYNKFPIKFAFSDEQFKKSMGELGLNANDTDKIVATGGGGFIKKEDKEAYSEMVNRFNNEFEEAISEDTTGRGFIKDMFSYELANHEYCYTHDLTDTLDSLGLDMDKINSNDSLKKGLKSALNQYEKEIDELEMECE